MPTTRAELELTQKAWYDDAHGEVVLLSDATDALQTAADPAPAGAQTPNPPTCIECGEPWPCTATVRGTDRKTPHRIGVVSAAPAGAVGDANREWEALIIELDDPQPGMTSWGSIARHRPLIEAALRATPPTPPGPLDVERLARALKVSWNHPPGSRRQAEAIAAEYARLHPRPTDSEAGAGEAGEGS